MSYLCEDLLILEVFSRLPLKSLFRFRSVSKSLCAIIGSPSFIRLHALRSPKQVIINVLYHNIQTVIEAGLITPLVNLLQTAEFDIKKEVAWAISSATSGATNEQIKFLVSQGCIKPLCDLLVCPNPGIVVVSLKGLENILKVGEVEKRAGHSGDVNFYAQMIDDADGLEKIENLQSHDNNEIYMMAVKIFETYWLDENVADGAQASFHFGGNNVQVPSGGFNF